MLERDMEDLIAEYPEDFFPGHGFVLKGRQQSFAGVGRFDLLFADRYATNVLMELKAVVARYEHATQLAKYKDALENQGAGDILMWLVAPHIPNAVREFLDRIGIEYSEIHEAQFRRVADRHGKKPDTIASPERGREERNDAVPVAAPAGPLAPVQPAPELRLLPEIDKGRIASLLDDFGAAAKRKIDHSLATRLRSEIIHRDPPTVTRRTALQLARWCKTDGIYADGMEIAKEISEALFGYVLDRNVLGT